MSAEILYELARNNVYGDLGRALAGLQHNCLGLLAAERAEKLPELRNDTIFYHETLMGRNMIGALEDFCTARCRGEDHGTAHGKLMDSFGTYARFPFTGASDIETRRLKALENAPDSACEKTFRHDHLEEFRDAILDLSNYLKQNNMFSWSHQTILRSIDNRIDSFADPAVAAYGFDKFPVPAEVQYIADAAIWLKQRANMAKIKSMPGPFIDMSSVSGIFERVSGKTYAEKMQYAQYAACCECLGMGLAESVVDGSYIIMLINSCTMPHGAQQQIPADIDCPVSANPRSVLTEFARAYKECFMDDSGASIMDAMRAKSAESVVADFLSEFLPIKKMASSGPNISPR